MAQVRLWEGYRGEFAKTGGAETEGAMKAVAYGLSRLASTPLYMLDTHRSAFKEALRIGLARVNSDYFEPNITKKNLNVTGNIDTTVFTGLLKVPGEHTVKVVIKQLTIKAEDIWKTRDMFLHLDSNRTESLVGAFYENEAFFITKLTLGSWNLMQGPLSTKTTLRLGLQLLEALQWSHASGIIHCDVNPNNCLITSCGNLVLSNFRNAVILRDGDKSVKVDVLKDDTGYNDFEYLVSKEVNQLSDVFAAACTIFKMETEKELSRYMDEYYSPKDLGNRRKDALFSSRSEEDELPRQSYFQRIDGSNFKDMLGMMVVSRDKRSDATDVLTNSKTKRLMDWYGLEFDKLDDCTEQIQSTLDEIVEDTDTEFANLDEPNETEKVLGHFAMAGIYHDASEWSGWNDLVATEQELVRFFYKNKNQAWLLKLVHPVLKTRSIKQVIQRKLGKRVPSGMKKVINREATKIKSC